MGNEWKNIIEEIALRQEALGRVISAMSKNEFDAVRESLAKEAAAQKALTRAMLLLLEKKEQPV